MKTATQTQRPGNIQHTTDMSRQLVQQHCQSSTAWQTAAAITANTSYPSSFAPVKQTAMDHIT
jgi:hypothetical protein